jgi:hypothetical protein
MGLASFLDELSGKADAALRGYTTGLTGGIIKYPQAYVNQWVNGGTLDENLAGIRESEAQLAKDHPGMYYGANIAGAVQPAGAIMKVLGGGAKAALAANTAMGAINGATANASAEGTTGEDTAMGAGMGLAGGTLGALGGKVVQGMANKAATYGLQAKLLKSAEWVTGAKDTLMGMLGRNPTAAEVKNFARQEATGMVQGAGPTVGGKVEGPKSTLRDLAAQGVKSAFEGVVPAAVGGAGVGALSTLYTGQDPIDAAKTGALSLVAARKGLALKNLSGNGRAMVGRYLANSPNLLGVAGAPAAAGLTSPLQLGSTVQSPAPTEFEQYKVNPRKSTGVVTDEGDEWEQFKVPQTTPAVPDEWEQFRAK